MLDFLMNPSFNQSLTNNLSWLGPWLFMLLTLVKITLIVIGSLIISGLALLTAATLYAGIKGLLRFVVRPVANVMAVPSASIRPPASPFERPHLAA